MIANQSAADEYREIAGRFTALVEGVPDEYDVHHTAAAFRTALTSAS